MKTQSFFLLGLLLLVEQAITLRCAADTVFGPISTIGNNRTRTVQTVFEHPLYAAGPYQAIVAVSHSKRSRRGRFEKTRISSTINSTRISASVSSRRRKTIIAKSVSNMGELNFAALSARANKGSTSSLHLVSSLIPPDERSFVDTTLTLENHTPGQFYNLDSDLTFLLSGVRFGHDLELLVLTINGEVVSHDGVILTSNHLTIPTPLSDGRNDIAFEFVNEFGIPIYFSETLWAGANTFTVSVVDSDDSPVVGHVEIIARLSDDETVVSTAVSSAGFAEFYNLPSRTILFAATGPGNSTGDAGALGSDGAVTLVLNPIAIPSEVSNNDFSLGLDGWILNGSPASILEHVEDFPTASLPQDSELAEAAETPDHDLALATSGEGRQSVARSFSTMPGVTSVKIRYRFITSEVPGGYFGSSYNDYFSISIRSKNAGGSKSESNSMNGMGLSAFDFSSGATSWREFSLPLSGEGDVVQFDVAVANVGDGAYDSYVIIDYIEEVSEKVDPKLRWNPVGGGIDLSYVVDGELSESVDIRVYWASSSTIKGALGAPFHTFSVQSGTSPGTYGPVRITGSVLENNPPGTEFIVAVAGETREDALKDVSLIPGPSANMALLQSTLRDIIEDGARVAGAEEIKISRTAVDSEGQARAMMNNLVRSGNSLTDIISNLTAQKALYAPAGDEVLAVFESEISGLTAQEIFASRASIQSQMKAKIDEQLARNPPTLASKHLGDPATITVLDISYKSFGSNRTLFKNSVGSRVDKVLDEPENSCLHLEKTPPL